ncbi:MAG TPA: LysR family transcriptional regulator [Kofleriaceae bacterium]|jgi:LysR family transcriptional activator of mexEF-oprN operon
MPKVYGRDLDLNLLRVFSVVSETSSVTESASRLYLTQPAVSAALRRLTTAVGAPLFVRVGRGLQLTSRGVRLRESLKPHLQALLEAALEPVTFDPATSDRTLRLGLSDSTEAWLLPPLLRILEAAAPRMRVVSIPVQFRTVGALLQSGGIDMAVTVADEQPATILRQRMFTGPFCCLYDPRHLRIGTLDEKTYFAQDHIIVSYNGDLRGVIEDVIGKQRRIRCSISSFSNLGALLDGTRMIATIPEIVADQIRVTRPHLRKKPKPFKIEGAWNELLWPVATDDDPACQFARDHILAVGAKASKEAPPTRR